MENCNPSYTKKAAELKQKSCLNRLGEAEVLFCCWSLSSLFPSCRESRDSTHCHRAARKNHHGSPHWDCSHQVFIALFTASPCLGKVILDRGLCNKENYWGGESSLRVDNMPLEQWDFYGQKDKQNVGCDTSLSSLCCDELMN